MKTLTVIFALVTIIFAALAPPVSATSFNTSPDPTLPTEDSCTPPPNSDYTGPQKHGFCFDRDYNGHVVEYGVYERGVKQGLWVYKAPWALYVGEYKDGKAEGFWVHEENPLMMGNQIDGGLYRYAGEYLNGERHGEWFFWRGIAGKKIVIYRNGEEDTSYADLSDMEIMHDPTCNHPLLRFACRAFGFEPNRQLDEAFMLRHIHDHCPAEELANLEQGYAESQWGAAAKEWEVEADAKNMKRFSAALLTQKYMAQPMLFDQSDLGLDHKCRAALHLFAMHPETDFAMGPAEIMRYAPE